MTTTEFDPVQWLEGLPKESSITEAEVRRIWELGEGLPEGALLVELGVWQGRSACLLARIAYVKGGCFYGIDHFQHPGCSAKAVVERMLARGLEHHSVIIAQSTAEVLWQGRDGRDLRIDFLHIDADHCSPGIDADCLKFLPLVKAGGIVAFDDYHHLASEAHYPDVKRVADQWCANEAFEDLGGADGMQFFRRRP